MHGTQANRVLIIGGHGQDGRLLQKLLLGQGSEVLAAGRSDLELHNSNSVESVFKAFKPDIVYYLAAYNYSSQTSPDFTDAEILDKSIKVHLLGCGNLLESIAKHNCLCKCFYASSARIFGTPTSAMQDENTPLAPICIYGITKAAGLECCRYYRKNRKLHVSTGILYNHESSIGKTTFLIRKVVGAAINILQGLQKTLYLGNLDARADWGYAPDYVNAMTLIMQDAPPDDYIIASGETHAVREVVEVVFGALGLDWRNHVVQANDIISRQSSPLCGNSQKLIEFTGWRPSVSFRDMILEILRISLDEEAPHIYTNL